MSDEIQRPHRPRRRIIVNSGYQVLFGIVLVLLQLNAVVFTHGLMQQRLRAVAKSSGSMEHFLSLNLWTVTLPSMLIVAAVTSVVLFSVGLWFSHRIVGPLPRLQRALRAIADGDYSVRLKFRPGDVLEHVADDVNHMVSELERRRDGLPPQSQSTVVGEATHEEAVSEQDLPVA